MLSGVLKKMVVGTRLEGPARILYSRFRRRSPEEGEIIKVFKRRLRRDSNCVDVGCHAGWLLTEMIRLAPSGVHYAFEPLPSLSLRIATAFRGYGNVHIRRCALSDRPGVRQFQHVVTDPAYSGFRRQRYPRGDESIEMIEVEVGPLDDIIPRGYRADLIKIDVEGAELEVLQGAIGTIRTSKATVVFEHGKAAAEYGTRPEEIYEVLAQECHLRVFTIQEWLKGGPALSRDGLVEQHRLGINFNFVASP